MPVPNKEKNREYVAKHRAKKQASDKEAYNKVNAGYIKNHREVLKEKIGEDAYKKQQAEYMKQYRASKKQIEQKQKSINTLTDAIKARKARQELLSRAVAKANETALLLEEQSNKARQIFNNAKPLLNQTKPTEKRKRGRPAKKQANI